MDLTNSTGIYIVQKRYSYSNSSVSDRIRHSHDNSNTIYNALTGGKNTEETLHLQINEANSCHISTFGVMVNHFTRWLTILRGG